MYRMKVILARCCRFRRMEAKTGFCGQLFTQPETPGTSHDQEFYVPMMEMTYAMNYGTLCRFLRATIAESTPRWLRLPSRTGWFTLRALARKMWEPGSSAYMDCCRQRAQLRWLLPP